MKEGIGMVGGLGRSRPPRDLARDPEAWPHAMVDDTAAQVVQAIARRLHHTLEEGGLSLRQTAAGAGVNRQTLADLLAGRSWPDVATVARLEEFLGVALYPQRRDAPVAHENRPFRPRTAGPGTTK